MTKCITIALLVLATVSFADIPHLLNYQGRITDDSGNPLDGSHELTFRIYDDSTGGTTLWTEIHPDVTVTDGLFDVVLGSIENIKSDYFSSQPRWLGIQVDIGAELYPRTQILAVAYAYRAEHAEHADTADYALDGAASGGGGWVDDGTVVRLDNSGDEVGIGTSNTDEKLHIENVVSVGRAFLQLETSHGSNWGECGLRLVTPANKWHLRMDDYSNNNLPVEGSMALRSNNSGKEVMTWTDNGDVGIGTTDPQEKLHVNGDIRLGSTSDIAFGDDNTRLYVASGGDMVLTADDDIYLQPDDDIFIGVDGGSHWVHFDNSLERLGIGILDPQEKLHVDGDIRLGASSDIAFGDDDTRLYATGSDMVLTADDDIRLQPDDDVYIRADGGQDWVHFDNSLERLGIGTLNPQVELHVDGNAKITGDLEVNGAYKGDISSSSGSDGAPFPRPAYNSGWLTIDQGEILELTHNIGGDPDDYFVDLQFWSTKS